MKNQPKSKVKIKSFSKSSGFVIEVIDKYTYNSLAVTKEELEQIVLYGQLILRDETKKGKQ